MVPFPSKLIRSHSPYFLFSWEKKKTCKQNEKKSIQLLEKNPDGNILANIFLPVRKMFCPK